MKITLLYVRLTDPWTGEAVAIRTDQIVAMYPLKPQGDQGPTTFIILEGRDDGVLVTERVGQVLDAIEDVWIKAAEQ